MMKQKRANDECSKKHLLESHPENPLPTCYSIYIIIYILYIIYILLYNYYYKIFLQVKSPFLPLSDPLFSVCSFRCFPAFSWFIHEFLLIDFSLLFLSTILPADKHGEQSENKSVT